MCIRDRYECGATFTKDIDQQTSPILSFLVTGLLPLIIFIVLGNYMAKKLMEQAGGKNSMAFGMGKSNAKVYVQSSEGIRFSDVAGEDEAKENLAEIVDYLHNPKKYTDVGASMPVSYTHLDVYKRQAQTTAETAGKAIDGRSKPDMEAAKSQMEEAEKVRLQTQTKLELYKEQYKANKEAYDILSPQMEKRGKILSLIHIFPFL